MAPNLARSNNHYLHASVFLVCFLPDLSRKGIDFFYLCMNKNTFFMATWVLTLLFSVGAVLLFVVGLSLTLMIKGHHIDGEISTNRHMRERGITCAVKDAVGGNAHGGSDGDGGCDDLCADKSCATCVG
jgi:hypothetical protein